MIWIIVNKEEEDGTFPTYKFYKQAFNDRNIEIVCCDFKTDFSFIKNTDIAIVRTRNELINSRLKAFQVEIGFSSTLESKITNFLTHDKLAVKYCLLENDIPHPKSVGLRFIQEGMTYFVKPRFGENSDSIDDSSICYSPYQVQKKYRSLVDNGIVPLIEEYIDGYDVTTAIVRINSDLVTYSITTETGNKSEIQTSSTKKLFDFNYNRYENPQTDILSKRVFNAIKAQHLLRIDYRIADGNAYVLDINMIPGLAPNGYWSRCMEANGIDYYESIRMIVKSAF